MQIVIDIPDEEYKKITSGQPLFPVDADLVINAVCCGRPLPKGHGRLVDVNGLYEEYEYNDWDFYHTLKHAQTIVEADR